MLANQINQGDHVAFFFKTKEEQLATVIPFIAIGLEKNEQCLYIANANTPAEIRQQLQAYGVDVDAAKKSGALSITALCQYDEARFPGALVERMKQLHPVVIADGKLRRKSLMTASKIAV